MDALQKGVNGVIEGLRRKEFGDDAARDETGRMVMNKRRGTRQDGKTARDFLIKFRGVDSPRNCGPWISGKT